MEPNDGMERVNVVATKSIIPFVPAIVLHHTTVADDPPHSVLGLGP